MVLPPIPLVRLLPRSQLLSEDLAKSISLQKPDAKGTEIPLPITYQKKDQISAINAFHPGEQLFI